MFSKTILVGNLTRDVEIRYTQGGVAIAKSSIATTRKFTQNGEKKEEVCFIDITFFGRSGEVANQYLRKGSKILVEGHLVFEQWVDNNGQKRSKHSVTVETMQMLDTKNSNTQQGQSPQQGYNSPQQQSQAPQQNQSYGAQHQGQGQQSPQQGYNSPQQQSQQMPQHSDIPSIDVDDDQPF